ncbi:MAG: sigma-54-dependent transcriptional regulator [Calditrichia bacterium]
MSEVIFPAKPVLIVDDEENFLDSVSFILNAEGISNIVMFRDSRDVMPFLSENEVTVVLLDILMPHISGKDLLNLITRDYPGLPVIMSTALNEVDVAVDCMKCGAFDYLVKPIDETRLISSIKRGIELRELRNENILLKQYLLSDKLEHPEAFSEIVTQSGTMRAIFQYVEAISKTSLPVLITGETGVGKELIANAIHKLSGRRGKFVPVNVAGVDDQLFSDTLFGHKRGAFTGADRERKGLIEQAANGTLFLDEIGDLSLESQVKLLQVLQEGKYYPIGSDIPKMTNARIVIATNRDLVSLQEKGDFRKDLFYRLQAHHIHIPPLRQRLDDLEILITHFLDKAAHSLNKKRPTAPRELVLLLKNYLFPGNIRELEGMIFDAVSQHKSGILSLNTFKQKMSRDSISITSGQGEISKSAGDSKIYLGRQFPTLREATQLLIEEAMQRANGNQNIAARMLGISRRALNNRLSRMKK